MMGPILRLDGSCGAGFVCELLAAGALEGGFLDGRQLLLLRLLLLL